MTTEAIIRDYFDGWLKSDRDKVRSCLADDLKFWSPDDNFDDADSFLDACWKYSEHFAEMTIEHGVYASDSGYIVYTSGDLCSGELIKIRDGKICEIYVTFNPTY
jgi:ketosteroid isomerase-like protein